ncbi:MAG TPA: ornithine--oxo-acid transaminase [Solirubrobacteraceae bacterium]
MHDFLESEERYGASNYLPLPVVLARGEGAWVEDVDGRRYFDALAAYSALNLGHCHPRLVEVAREQAGRLTLTSRAFHNDQLGPFCRELAEFTGTDRVLPMNTGVEAVETALKLARKWGYARRGVAPGRARIVVCAGNFHGRTTTVVGFSDDPLARDGFGPYGPGFVTVPYGDAAALRAAIDDDTVAFLVEPIQGESGVVIPPDGYLADVRAICAEADVLMIADEVQSGLGRSGRRFACDHEGVVPDLYVLGKALGGGIVPLSAVAGRDDVLGVLRPGEHGSTFGGNPLACAIGREVLRMLADDGIVEASAALGDAAAERLRAAAHGSVREVRQRGLWLGVELVEAAQPARPACERLMDLGVLAKDTHETTIRFSPPLVTSEEDLGWALDRLDEVLAAVADQPGAGTGAAPWR